MTNEADLAVRALEGMKRSYVNHAYKSPALAETDNHADIDAAIAAVRQAFDSEHTARRIQAALEIAQRYGQTDGAHHKAWVIDQLCRALLGADYTAWVLAAKAGEDGPNTYGWDEGVPP